MIKMYTPFSYSFGYVGTVSTFWTPHDILLWDYFQLMLPSKIKLPTQVPRAHKKLAPHARFIADVICVDNDTD